MPVPPLTQGLVRIATFFGGAACLAGLFRFPGLVCQHGGGAFFIAYAVCLAVLVRPVLRAFRQWSGRFCQPEGQSATGFACRLAFGDKALALAVSVLATLAVLTLILISAWCLGLAWKLASGIPASDPGKTFGTLSGQAANGVLWTRETAGVLPWLAVVVALVFLLSGSGTGQRWGRLLRPALPLALLAVILLLLPRLLALGVPNAALPSHSVAAGLDLIWQPTRLVLEERPAGQDRFYRLTPLLPGSPAYLSAQAASVAAPDTFQTSRLGLVQALCDPRLWLAAVGQVVLALVIAAGSALSQKNVPPDRWWRPEGPSLWFGLLAGGLLGCLLALPAGAAYLGGVSADSGPFGPVFAALPSAFRQLPGGRAWGGLLFLLAGVSALAVASGLLRRLVWLLETALGLSRGRAACLLLPLHVASLGALTWATRSHSALGQMDFWSGVLAAASATVLLLRAAASRPVPLVLSTPATLSRLKRLLERCRRLAGWGVRWTPPLLLLGMLGFWATHQILALAVSDREFHLEPQVASLCAPDSAQGPWFGLLPLFLALLLFALVLKTSKGYCRLS